MEQTQMMLQALEMRVNVMEGTMAGKAQEIDGMKGKLDEYVMAKEEQDKELKEALKKFEENVEEHKAKMKENIEWMAWAENWKEQRKAGEDEQMKNWTMQAEEAYVNMRAEAGKTFEALIKGFKDRMDQIDAKIEEKMPGGGEGGREDGGRNCDEGLVRAKDMVPTA